MGLPTAIMANMTSEQLEAYTLHLRIEEISQKLRIDDVVPADGDRYVSSPSFLPSIIVVIPNTSSRNLDLLRLRRSMTTMVAVSTPENIVTGSALRMNATN